LYNFAFFGLLCGVFGTAGFDGALLGGDYWAMSKQLLIQCERPTIAADFLFITSRSILGSSLVPEFGIFKMIYFALVTFWEYRCCSKSKHLISF